MNDVKDTPETSFAEAFEASLNFKTPEQGEMLRGTIVSISGEDAYVSYGGPSEAVIATAELEGQLEGDTVEAIVVSTGSQIRMSRKLLAGKASMEALRGAYESRLPVEGKVIARNKGGFDVTVSGIRAFCPLSQIDLGKIDNPDDFVGKSYEFRITELSGDGRKIVVSRAAMLREEASARADEARKSIVPGAIITGSVKSIMPFGAFVDLGGIDGLLHVSEMSRRRITDPKEIVTVGQEVTVKVLKLDETGKRVSLSMKEFERDPWQDVADRFPSGTRFTGKIARATDFGFFVELEPGIDGLLHVSQLPIGMKRTDDALQVGGMITGWIREVDPAKRRISLAMREVALGDPWEEAQTRYGVGSVAEGTVERSGPAGLFVELEPGLTGLIPISELAVPAGSDPSKTHPAGQRLKVTVLSIDPQRKRIALSHEGAKEAEARGEYLQYVDQTKASEAATAEGKSAMALALEKAMQKST